MAQCIQFTFNCYFHWYLLVIHDMGGTGSFLHKLEGVTQGDHQEMIMYDIGIINLIR